MADTRLALAGQRRHPVLLAAPADPEVLARLAYFFEIEVDEGAQLLDGAELGARLHGKSGLIARKTGRIDAALLARLPHLRAVCKVGSMHGDIDLDACTHAGVIVTNTPDLGDDAAAQRKMAAAAAENLIAAFGFGRSGGHPKDLLNTELHCVLGCCL
jgi:phosphoglycerate dehydrogenase-like enzyme